MRKASWAFIAVTFLMVHSVGLKASFGAGEIKCSDKVIVTYLPGENLSKLDESFEAHLTWVTALMESGKIIQGGPLKEGEAITGALMVYDLAELAEVRKLADGDPFVLNSVFKYEAKSWRMCRFEKGE